MEVRRTGFLKTDLEPGMLHLLFCGEALLNLLWAVRCCSVYDLWDLGEFDQKGTVRTKYGTKDELLGAIQAAHDAKLQLYADVVVNQRFGADETEDVVATPYNIDNRYEQRGPSRRIRAWTKFTFKGRGGKYSNYVWDKGSIDAVDYDENVPHEKHAFVYLLEGHKFDEYTSREKGNYDYLSGADTDTDKSYVVKELNDWGQWMVENIGFDGFRIDAVKHMDARFFRDHWLPAVRRTKPDLFAVGEYLDQDLGALEAFLRNSKNSMDLFDFPLHFKFHNASNYGNWYDMGQIFQGTLVGANPTMAVTFVDNHDTVRGHHATPVQQWFLPIAYAILLLRRGGYPCIFYRDYYGDGTGAHQPLRGVIDKLLTVRRKHAYGNETDYLHDHPRHIIGWTREGGASGKALAVVVSSGPGGSQWMRTKPGARFMDFLGNVGGDVVAKGDGWAEFRCDGGSVSVWVEGWAGGGAGGTDLEWRCEQNIAGPMIQQLRPCTLLIRPVVRNLIHVKRYNPWTNRACVAWKVHS